MQGLRKLHARGLWHGNIQKEHLDATAAVNILLATDEGLDCLPRVGGLLYAVNTTRLLEQEPQLGARRILVVDDKRIHHAAITWPSLP